MIDEEATRVALVIVDLEGTASRMIPYAMSRADLVIIPTRAPALDAVDAVAAIREVRQQEEASRVKIPAAILFTCTSAAIRTRTLRSIEGELQQNSVPVLATRLHERDAFRAIFSFGGTLRSLERGSAPNVPGAIESARQFAAEVVEVLRRSRSAAAA